MRKLIPQQVKDHATTFKKLSKGQVVVVFNPQPKGSDYVVELKIDDISFGKFPTYGCAAEYFDDLLTEYFSI